MGDREDSKGARVYVGGLSESISKEDLEGEFEKFGTLNNVWVALNPPGFAFVEFSSLTDAETACDNLNGAEFLGSKLRVEIARGGRGGRGSFRGGRGRGGGFQSRDRYDNYGGGSRGFRGGRPSGRFDSYRGGGGSSYGKSDSSRFGSRDYDRGSSAPYSRDRSSGYGGRGGGGGYRSRSPAGGDRY